MAFRIFIVEDDPKIANGIHAHLDQYGYFPRVIRRFDQVEEEFKAFDPHLVIMDVNLPFQDGFYLCHQIRRYSAVPVLFLTARTGEMEQIFGLESGGDDYMTKPFSLQVMLAKVKALLRRSYGEYAERVLEPSVLHVGDLRLDLTSAQVQYGEETQSLTKNELKLLALLMEKGNQVVSRGECLEALWDDSQFVDDNTLTVNVTRLRKKLAVWGMEGMIRTHRGLGYQLITAKNEFEK